MTWPTAWKNCTLILAGHGSSRHPLGSKTVKAHAEAIREMGLFAEIRTVFWKEQPRFAEALDNLTTAKAYIVPLLASDGYITRDVLPREIGFEDCLMKRDGVEAILCKAVGTHETLPTQVGEACREKATLAGLSGGDTTLLLIGHGNEKNPASANQTETVAEAARSTGFFARVKTAYLDQAPFVADWRNFSMTGTILTVPFMISGGIHAAQDLPEALGILDKVESAEDLYERQGPIGPFSVDGMALYYCRPMGCESFISQLVLEQVAEADEVL
jgi:sirohydrochlorin cobaltochelatase